MAALMEPTYCGYPYAPFFDYGFGDQHLQAFGASSSAAHKYPTHESQDLHAMWNMNARLAYENMMLRQQSMAFAPPGLNAPVAWSQIDASQTLRSRSPSSDASTTAVGSNEDDEQAAVCIQIKQGPKVQKPDALPSSMHASVMMRNLPNCYTRNMLLELLDAEGYMGSFDFLYLPIDFRRGLSLGYAFINFTSPSMAEGFRSHFTGFSEWCIPSDKICQVTWSETLHGLQAHLERYMNSPVMHESVPDEHKPVLFSGLKRVSFPRPTKKIRAPRLWHTGKKHDKDGDVSPKC